MKLSRRELLKAAAVTGLAVPLTGCEGLTSEFLKRTGADLPDSLSVSDGVNIDPIFHLLSRAGYGPAPGDMEHARDIGAEEWLEEQLQPDKIDDKVCDLRSKRFETLHLDPGTCYEFKRPVLRDELSRRMIVRATYSKKQLLEAMVEFWDDHLNIYIEKGDCIYLKPADDRLVVRKHALGKFRDLIRESATSPAMLVYLDGNQNRKAGKDGIPNENYARELLELHTLGVHGGYTQQDVFEVGRCLTGWRLHTPWQRAKVYFDKDEHDDGEKHVLGHVIPAGGGEQDLERVLDIVCNHRSTAHHIATKMVARFVSDDAPASLVKKTADEFTRTKGDIKSLVRTVFNSPEFYAAKGSKFKRPVQYVVFSLRMLGADTYARGEILEYLTRMGQAPFQHPFPDGYADRANQWTSNLLWRWNYALALPANKIEGTKVPLDELIAAVTKPDDSHHAVKDMFAYFTGRRPNDNESIALSNHQEKQLAGGAWRRPYRQWRHQARHSSLLFYTETWRSNSS